MKGVPDPKAENNTGYKIAMFQAKQGLPYEAKRVYAARRAWEFYDKMNGGGHSCHVSVGGLDSITLLCFLRSIGINVPAISVSSLEDKSIQRIHKRLGVIPLAPGKSKVAVIREYGYPIISKEAAAKIAYLQHPTTENATTRRAIMTGIKGNGEYSKYMRLPQRWLELFGGPENEAYGTNYGTASFQVSDACCYWMKEQPCDQWAREHDSFPYQGLMAVEEGRRERKLMRNGCNYYGISATRSAPFAIFTRQDLLRLALELKVPVPEIYGNIEEDLLGNLYTTRAQRTGCAMCGFGVHMEKRPHRFDRLYEDNPKEWRFWMYEMGWGEVLDYIGVEWRQDEHSSGQLMWFPTEAPKRR